MITVKTVGGVRYLYFREWDPITKRKKEVYCGPESSLENQNKARELERQYLMNHVRSFQQKLDELNDDVRPSDTADKQLITTNGQILETIPRGYSKLDGERLSLEREYTVFLTNEPKLARHVSYVANRDVPLLRLYRYKEAFGFDFARLFIERFHLTSDDYLFDPFMGMGSTLFAAMLEGVPSIGLDKLPVAAFLASTIPLFLKAERGKITETFERARSKVDRAEPCEIAEDILIMKIGFSPSNLERLRKWKTVIEDLEHPYREILRLLFFSVLEETSYTSKDGQFLRLKREKKLANPDEALKRKVELAEEDLRRIGWFFSNLNHNHSFIPETMERDSLDLSDIPFRRSPTAIITSPPYLNRYDYTRSYGLELCFHFVKNMEELKQIRQSIIRSHIESKLTNGEKPHHPAVQEVIGALEKKELNNPNIPAMIIGYFNDMKKAIEEWFKVLAPQSKVGLVVDNVRFEGELIPVDLILTDIASDVGFRAEKILITRYKGNSSQQMGKYGRVPVRESVAIWSKP